MLLLGNCISKLYFSEVSSTMTRFAYAEPLPAVALSLVRAPAPDQPSGFNQPGEAEPPFRKHLRRRERLPLDSRALWEIESGFFRSLTWDEEGNLTTLGIWGPGEHMSIAFSTLSPLHLECLTSGCLRQILNTVDNASHDDVGELMRLRAQRTEELLYFLQIRCTQTRIRKILGWLAQRFGRSISTGILLPLRLTHQEWADLIGSTRVTVTRLMKQLQQQGELELCGRSLIVHSSLVNYS